MDSIACSTLQNADFLKKPFKRFYKPRKMDIKQVIWQPTLLASSYYLSRGT